MWTLVVYTNWLIIQSGLLTLVLLTSTGQLVKKKTFFVFVYIFFCSWYKYSVKSVPDFLVFLYKCQGFTAISCWNTGSCMITKVNQYWAWLVPWWVTTWEYQLLLAGLSEGVMDRNWKSVSRVPIPDCFFIFT